MQKSNNINLNLSKILPRIFFSAIPVLLLTFLLSSELLSDTSAEKINVNVFDGSYTMSIAADDLDVDIDATPAGVQRAVQKDVTVFTNSGTGYRLYLSMNNNDANGNRLYYNADTSSDSFISPTASASSLSGLSINSWGFSKDGSNYAAVPLQGSETLLASAATTPSSPVTTSVYYGFNINNSLPFGSYTGTVTYTLVGDAAATPKAKVTVANFLDDKTMADPAGGDTLKITTSLMTNMQNIGNVTVTVGGTSCPVTGTTTKDKFLEISCTAPAKTAGSYTVAISVPKFDKSYNTTLTYNGGLFGAGMNKIRTMQGMKNSVCSSMSTPAAFTSGTTINTNVPEGKLKDTRNDASYIVRKLADGNCWMAENLRLALTSGTQLEITNSSTGESAGLWTIPAAVTNDGSATNPINRNTKVYNNTDYYYSYWAATAGYAGETGDATNSICPIGWRMPAGATYNKSYYTLYTTYGEQGYNSLKNAPISISNLGRYESGYRMYTSYMLYGESLSANSTNMYALNASSERVMVNFTGEGKGFGEPVRCVNANRS